MWRANAAAVLALMVLHCAGVRAEQVPSVSVTVYSTAQPDTFDPRHFIGRQREAYGHAPVPGFGIIRDTRTLSLSSGANRISFTDVAAFIDPTTVSLVDLSAGENASEDERIRVLDQQFQFDLVSPQKLLEKYIDQPITLNRTSADGQREPIRGTLLAHQANQIVLRTDAGVRIIGWTPDIQLGDLPGGLITRPTLVWNLWSPTAGQRRVRTAYQTDGVTWRADYNLVLDADETRADLGAWVTLLNLSGTGYPDAELKLVAGDVQRFEEDTRYAGSNYAQMSTLGGRESEAIQEQALFEYHLYTLPRRVTIEHNSTQQLPLFPTVTGVATEKMLVYFGVPDAGRWRWSHPQLDRNLGARSTKKVDVYVRFDNREDNRLGIPLPRGKVRVFKASAPAEGETGLGALEFLGEDVIDHTSKNESVLVKTGQSFDVTGERVQEEFRYDASGGWIKESFRITVRNAKKAAQKVTVREVLYRWSNWDVVRQSEKFEKVDSRTIHFDVEVPPEGEKVVTYTVKYTL